MRSLKKAQEAIEKELGKELMDSENVYLYANHIPSINKNKKEVFDNKYLKPFTSLLKRLYEKKVNGNKLDEKAIERYTNAKHGIERNREMSVKNALTEVQDGKKVFNENDREAVIARLHSKWSLASASGLRTGQPCNLEINKIKFRQVVMS